MSSRSDQHSPDTRSPQTPGPDTRGADTLEAVGESAALARIFPRLPAAASALLGPGDDAAVVAAPDGRFVVTTDMMIHGPDFRLAWSTPHDLGWKAAASNLSDVAAMGAVPSALVVAIAAPADSPVGLLEGIADGLRDACEALSPGCGVVGGDLSVSGTLTIAVTAFGDLEGRAPVLRSGARVGDVVAVAGVLGEAASALRLLFADAVDDRGEPDAALAAALRPAAAAQLTPRPPIWAGPVAARGGATAMLDLSDGLAIDSGRLAAASGVGIDFEGRLLGDDSALALAGGEDHSLLATFPAGAALPEGFRRIGVCVDGSGIGVDGVAYDPAGWDPYRDWSGSAG
ncbi:MAG TPA: thiamine-phosphate kinase [Lacisediminihabitans sp.]|uniref:thiamine-phosphate kinase n=1 Tax=Lacisediminihabitans sp. TaxID=2787631 RepID=UPI002EDB1A82